jgi:hypothetical protein
MTPEPRDLIRGLDAREHAVLVAIYEHKVLLKNARSAGTRVRELPADVARKLSTSSLPTSSQRWTDDALPRNTQNLAAPCRAQ